MAKPKPGLPSPVTAPSDRRFHRSDRRRDRPGLLRRALIRLVRWGMVAAIFAVAGVWLADRVLASDALAIRHLVVRGNTQVSTEQIDALVGSARGQNIFHVNLDRYRASLVRSPWVQSATLWRELPSTLEIRIVERTPLAIARIEDALYLVDDAGVVIDAYTPAYRGFDLPIVDGLVQPPVVAGSAASADRLALTRAMLGALAADPAIGPRVSQIDVSNPHDALVLFGDETACLHLGDEAFVPRLTTYLELLPTLRDRFRDIDYVDLRFGDRVYVHSRARGVARAAGGVSKAP